MAHLLIIRPFKTRKRVVQYGFQAALKKKEKEKKSIPKSFNLKHSESSMNSSFWSEAECVSKFISRCAVPMNVRLQPGVLLLDLQSSAPGHGAVLRWTNSACKSISELSVVGKAAASSSHTAAVAPVWESFYWRCSFGCRECRSAVRWWCQMSDWPGVLTLCSLLNLLNDMNY